MTNELILKKAIEKAKSNGYNLEKETGFVRLNYERWMTYGQYHQFIFNHQFAKAFWGEGDLIQGSPHDKAPYFRANTWQHHLQQMVLEKEPLKYLEKFLSPK